MNYLELGSAPTEEECVQVTADGGYLDPMKKECARYRDFLRQRFPFAAPLFFIRCFDHDLGSYYEVCIRYDDHDEAQEERAFFIQEHLPDTWDDAGTVPYAPTPGISELPAYSRVSTPILRT